MVALTLRPEGNEGGCCYPKRQMRDEIASTKTPRQECLPTVAVKKPECKGRLVEQSK